MKTAKLSTDQHDKLIEKIYEAIMSDPNAGLGEMGEATDEAKRIVTEWMTENSVVIDDDAIVTQVQLSNERRADMLCGAIEGGSNYWYFLDDDADEEIKKFIPDLATLRKTTPFVELMWSAIEKGAVIPVRDAEDEETVLGHISLKSIEEGEALMLAKHPSHFGNIISEDGDADTADVWFQYAVLKEIVYG